MSDDLGPTSLDIRPAKAPFWSRISVVWLVPLLALVISLGIAWKSYSDRGELITITFENASGIEVGQTHLKFRDVTVGIVEDVEFAPGLTHVIVSVRVDTEILPYLDENAQFWIVRPEISARGISGLNTVLSGVYLQGNWDTEIATAKDQFEGLEEAPVIDVQTKGTRITLRAKEGGRLDAGSPILYKGIEVGRVETPRLSENGDFVLIDAVIDAPHDQRLTTASRFWDRSGFSISLDTSGVNLDVGSLGALVQGGLSFDTVFSGGEPIEPGEVFEIFDDEQQARNSLFNSSNQSEVSLSVIFDNSVNGLTAGAPVRYKGINVGAVSSLTAFVDNSRFRPRVRLLVNFTVQPNKLGLQEDATEEDTLDFLENSVASGLRIKLATQSLISSSLLLELVEMPDEPSAVLDRTAEPFPRLPSIDAELTDFTATAEGMFERINALPVEELMQAAIDVLESVNAVAASEGMREAPDELIALLADTRALINSEDLQATPGELRGAIGEMNTLLADIRKGGAAASLLTALENASAASVNISAASENLPALVEELNALSAKANTLALEELVTSATSLMSNADKVVGSEEAAAIPGELASALAEVNTMLVGLREGGAVADLLLALDEASAASVKINSAATGLPALAADFEELAAKANDLPLTELVTSATSLIETADTLIGTEDAAAVPAALSGALNEVKTVLAEIREGGAVANANATLASTQSAAEAVEKAAASLPALSERLNGLVARAEATLAGYGGNSEFNRQTLTTLREVSEAAEALSSLARAIERRPNSLIIGR